MRPRGAMARDVLAAGLLILVAALAAAALQARQGRALAGSARIIDGDTIRLDGAVVRLRGIDAPELRQTCTGADGAEHACGRLSARYLETLVGASAVTCAGRGTDRYGRLLGDCSVGSGASGIALNRTMVEAGWAVAFGDHERVQAMARADKRGMWAWDFEQPADWRRRVAAEAGAGRPAIGPGALVRRARAAVGWRGHNE